MAQVRRAETLRYAMATVAEVMVFVLCALVIVALTSLAQ
jgi:hypothetical protein